MNKDELDGKTDQLKGKSKQAAGDMTDNEWLLHEGVADEAKIRMCRRCGSSAV